MDAESVYNVVKILGGLGGAWGVVAAVGRFVVKPWKNLCDTVNLIKKEVTPNGGGSLKDAVGEIKKSVSKIENWQRARLSHEGTCFFDLDANGRITWANRATLRELGATEDEVTGMNYRAQIATEDRARVAEEIDLATAEERDLKTCFRLRDGRCVEMALLVVKNGKDCTGYAGALTRKVAEFCGRG